MHRVIKGYWQEEAIDAAKAEVDAITNWRMKDASTDSANKRLCNSDFPPTIAKIIKRAMGREFIHRHIGYGLMPDPDFNGGGVHSILPGGYLKMHRDFNHVIGLGWRISNLLLYLNREPVGGDLLVGGDRIAPEANTMVILSPEEWHGHPEPCVGRRDSIALYYYSKDKPSWMTQRLVTDYEWTETSR